METKCRLLDEIGSHKVDVLKTVKIPVLEVRYQALAKQTSSTRNTVEAMKKRLPILKQYLIHRDTSKGLVEWLTDVNSGFQEAFNVDSLEDIEREIEAHCATKAALDESSQAIEGTIASAKTLEMEGNLSETDMKGYTCICNSHMCNKVTNSPTFLPQQFWKGYLFPHHSSSHASSHLNLLHDSSSVLSLLRS